MLLLHASFSRHFFGIRSRSSMITRGEKIFHHLDRSAEHPLQAALSLRHGSNECDRSSSTEMSSPVVLSATKHLDAPRERPFAAAQGDTV
jgi:hypothetical protein